MADPARRRPVSKGFTLLEVLIAFVIVTLIFGAAFRTFSTGIGNARHASDYTTAALWGDARLAELATEDTFTPGSTTGVFDGGYRWDLDIRNAPGTETSVDDPSMPLLYEIALRVSWGPPGAERSLRWKTFRLRAKERP